MKTKPNTGSTSAHPTALLLPLDADGFTRHLETIAGETPEIFAGKQPSRVLESAHRRAWCEVTEATGAIQTHDDGKHAMLAEVSAQRKLTDTLDGLMPAIALRNQTVAAASEQGNYLSYLKEDAEPLETELATLKARDARINPQGEMPNIQYMDDEINRIKNHLDNGSWKRTSLDFRDSEFVAGLRDLRLEGKYNGELTKEAAEQRLADLTVQVEEADAKLQNMLDLNEIQRLKELETKLQPMRAEIAAATDKASAMEAAAAAATDDLKVKIEAAAIIARAIIQACHIHSGITTAAA